MYAIRSYYGCPLAAQGRPGDDQAADLDVILQRAAGSHADHLPDTQGKQLVDDDAQRWCSHAAGRGDGLAAVSQGHEISYNFV